MTDAGATRGRGPGVLVAAAFLGPGTLTTASIAGAGFGFGLLWALLFSVATTLALQDMALRFGLGAGTGLAEGLRARLPRGGLRGILRAAVLLLVVVAIGVGNAAYEAGNLAGAALGAAELVPLSTNSLVLTLAALAALLLASGRYALVEGVLSLLVVVMGVVFLLVVVRAPPSLSLLATALQAPAAARLDDYLLAALALVGTTVVPYNLFLHASAAHLRWGDDADPVRALRAARKDACIAILGGGAVTLAVVSTAAVAFHGRTPGVDVSAATMAAQLEPVLGSAAGVAFALGLFAAGLTSAITAPLAAAWAVCGALGWPDALTGARMRLVWASVLVAGVLPTLLGGRPVSIIVIAQAANALLLPLMAGLLLWLANDRGLPSQVRNGPAVNAAAVLALAVVAALGLRRLLQLI